MPISYSVIIKKILLLFFILVSFENAVGSCFGPGAEAIGSFKLLKTDVAEIKCRGGVVNKLRMPGCLATLKKMKVKAGEQGEFKVYFDSELCDLKNGEVREMKILGSCCDLFFDVKCSDYPSGVFDYKVSNSTLACSAEVDLSVYQYKATKDGKVIVRQYNDEAKSFEDTNLKSIQQSSKSAKAKPNEKRSWLTRPFGSSGPVSYPPLKNK